MRNSKKTFLRRSIQVLLSSLIAVTIIGLLVFVTQGRAIPVLQPEGTIAQQQYVLILITVGLGVFVVVPVFILLFTIAWRYRAGNKKAKYDPDMAGHMGLELLWWGIPILIIFALAIVTSISTHALDPFKELQSEKEPVKVQVIALEWNWLFIYPDDNIATLNFMKIPEDTPINLSITADAPMNTFWVPALAGQVYAMSGMTSKLHLMADTPGSYNGSSTNISGEGYADMDFKVYSVSESDFSTWTKQTAKSQHILTSDVYNEISKPVRDRPTIEYKLMAPTLFNDVIMKYMETPKEEKPAPHDTDETMPSSHDMNHMEGMSH